MVERKHKHLLQTTRAILFQSKLPLEYWGECILTTTHLINRLFSNYLKNKYPYELLYNNKPDYSQLRSFGCLCYLTVPKPLRYKLELRTTPHIFVGYPFGTKGYKVMSLATKKIHASRDMVFHESIFPFSLYLEKPSFPSVLRSIPYIESVDYDILSTHKYCINDHRSDIDVCLNLSPQHYSSLEQPSNIRPPQSIEAVQNTNLLPQTTSIIVQRKSDRTKKIPGHLQDYIVSLPTLRKSTIDTQPSTSTNLSLSTLFNKHHHIFLDIVALTSQTLVENICHDSEPSSYEEASLTTCLAKDHE